MYLLSLGFSLEIVMQIGLWSSLAGVMVYSLQSREAKLATAQRM